MENETRSLDVGLGCTVLLNAVGSNISIKLIFDFLMNSKQKKTKRATVKVAPTRGKKLKQKMRGTDYSNLGPGLRVTRSQSTGRTSTSSLMSHPVFGGKLVSNTSSIPSAFVNIIGNSTYYNECEQVMRPELGLAPINLIGAQPFSDVTGAVATPDVFTTGTLATTVSVNAFYVTPDTFNGPLAAKANYYDHYVIRDLLFEYVSYSATTQANALAIGYSTDPITAPATFANTRLLVPSVTFPLRTDRAFLHYHFSGYSLLPNLIDTSSNIGVRQTAQGTVTCYASANLTVIVPGSFNVYYSVDLYNPVQSQGFTLMIPSKEERDFLKELMKLLEASHLSLDAVRVKGLDSALCFRTSKGFLTGLAPCLNKVTI